MKGLRASLAPGLVAATALALACASSGIVLPAVSAAPPGRAIVFGSVEVVGEMVADAALIAPGSELVSIWDIERGEEIAVHDVSAEASTDFYWHFPAGKYAIMHYREDRTISLILVSQHSSKEIRLGAEFEVSEDSPALYLGTLRIAIDRKRDRITKAIVDEFDSALPRFEQRNPQAATHVSKALLKFDDAR